jgi:DNA-binding PadR family transcriptional regulator
MVTNSDIEYLYHSASQATHLSGWLVVDDGSVYNHNVELMALGEFEYLLLTAAVRLGDEAYGAAIRHEVEADTGRPCSVGALYTTLDRLEQKALVKTWMIDPTPQRGGRPKRMVRVTTTGVRAATEFYDVVSRASRGVAWATGRGGRA